MKVWTSPRDFWLLPPGAWSPQSPGQVNLCRPRWQLQGAEPKLSWNDLSVSLRLSVNEWMLLERPLICGAAECFWSWESWSGLWSWTLLVFPSLLCLLCLQNSAALCYSEQVKPSASGRGASLIWCVWMKQTALLSWGTINRMEEVSWEMKEDLLLSKMCSSSVTAHLI